jgi:hypothetical protein
MIQKNGDMFSGSIQPDSFVSCHLTILHLEPNEFRWFKFWQRRYVLLLQDNSNLESFRQLRVYLLWHHSASAVKSSNLS